MSKDRQNNENERFDFSFLKKLLLEKGLKKELRHLPKFEYFLFLILKGQKEQVTFVPISNRLLKNCIRQEIITRIKRHLLDLDVIECDYQMRFTIKNGERIGQVPYKYRIKEEYYQLIRSSSLDGENEIYTGNKIAINQRVIAELMYNGNGNGFSDERIQEIREQFKNKVEQAYINRWEGLINLPQKPEYRYIQENAYKIDIDQSVYNWIEQQACNGLKLKPSKCEFINNNGKKVRFVNKNRTLNAEIAIQWKNHVLKIEEKNLQFSCPPSVNRVYYNVTSMPSELRKFLRYKGEELFYLDFSNFQPFLFIKTLRDMYKNSLPLDVQEYIDLTSRGDFYNDIKQKIETSGIVIKDPDSFKIDFFTRVFFSNEKRKYKYRAVFDKHFPSVSACISKTKEGNYKNLSILLQKLEAEVVINSILRQIAISSPDKFVLPIHDALVCEKGILDKVEKLMLDAAKEIIGYNPKIKIELLTSNAI